MQPPGQPVPPYPLAAGPGGSTSGQIPVVSTGPLPGPPTGYRPRPYGLIAILIAAAVVVVSGGAIGITYLVNRGGSDSSYTVGSCVTRHGETARPAPCSKPNAYRITKKVGSRSQCPDPDGPVVMLEGAEGDPVRCLAKVH